MKETLFIDDLAPGVSVSHDGAVVVRCFVPDSVSILAIGGGIVLEKGGGHYLNLETRAIEMPADPAVELSVQGESLRLNIGKSVYEIPCPPELRSLFQEQNIVPLRFTRERTTPGFSGVTALGAVGNEVKIKTQGSVSLQDTGRKLRVEARGSLVAGSVGPHSVIQIGGDCTADGISAGGILNIEGVLRVRVLDPSCCRRQINYYDRPLPS